MSLPPPEWSSRSLSRMWTIRSGTISALPFLAGLAQGLGREALLIRHRTTDAASAAADFRDDVVGVRSEAEIVEKVTAFCKQTLIEVQSIKQPSVRARMRALENFLLARAIFAETVMMTPS